MHEIGRESERSPGGRGNAILSAGPDAGKVHRSGRRGKGGTRRTAKADKQAARIVVAESLMQIQRNPFRTASCRLVTNCTTRRAVSK